MGLTTDITGALLGLNHNGIRDLGFARESHSPQASPDHVSNFEDRVL